MRRKTLAVLAGLVLLGLLALAFCPKPSLYGEVTFSTAVLDREGRLMRLALAADDRYRLRGSLEDISPTAVAATLLYEDRHFYRHPGFNPGSLLRAFWSTYVRNSRPIGASTITMQLARLRFGLDTRTLRGKLVQIARAVQLERHYDKDEILEAYLNLAPYGGNIEGIATAALVYFDKPAAALSMPEAFALAVIPQNPVRRDPSGMAGHEHMFAARARLLDMWADEQPLDDEARAQFAMPLAVRSAARLPFHAPHFSLGIVDENWEGFIGTTLDLDRQALLEGHIRRYVDRRRSRGIHNASALLVDYRSMKVVATVGSADFFDDGIQGQVDGTRAKRSPGSTLKPFVYALAIDQGLIHPSSLLRDAPTRFAAYTPENFDRGFMGPIKARDALIYSRNVPAIDLLARVGLDTFHDYLGDAGVQGLVGPDHYGLAMILGGNELTMHELVAQYAMLANGGLLKPLTTHDHGVTEVPAKRLLSPEASFLVLDMLRDNPRPDALSVDGRSERAPVAWKTGTSYAFRDAWTVGVFGPWVLAVWVGNFDGSANPAFVGREAAAPLFFEIADALLADSGNAMPDGPPSPGLNLRRIDVCAATGGLPGRYCPRTEKAWFIPGVSPIEVSDVYRAVRINNETGLRECTATRAGTREEVYEFWPSDLLALFRRAGMPVRQPPAWGAHCNIEDTAVGGVPPRITSPSGGVTYRVRIGRLENERIPFKATTDSDASRLYWFVDDRFIAEAGRDEPVFWKPVPGEYRILAIDDLGRSHARQVIVETAM